MAGGHRTHNLDGIPYYSEVTRDTVCIALTAELYNLTIKAAGILKACMMAPNGENTWTALGLEFGDDAPHPAIVAIVLNGL